MSAGSYTSEDEPAAPARIRRPRRGGSTTDSYATTETSDTVTDRTYKITMPMSEKTYDAITAPGMSEAKAMAILCSQDYEAMYLAASFCEIDLDGDGTVTVEELARYLVHSDVYAVTLLTEYDDNGDGVWTFNEFSEWMMENNRSILESSKLCVCEEIRKKIVDAQNENGTTLTMRKLYIFRKVFDFFDVDGGGHLDRREFIRLARMFMHFKSGGTLSKQRIKKALKVFLRDAELSVNVNEIEFRHFIGLMAGLTLAMLLAYQTGKCEKFIQEDVRDEDVNMDFAFEEDGQDENKAVWLLNVGGEEFIEAIPEDLRKKAARKRKKNLGLTVSTTASTDGTAGGTQTGEGDDVSTGTTSS